MIQQFLLLIKKQNGPSHDYQSHTNTLHAYIIIHPMLHSYSLARVLPCCIYCTYIAQIFNAVRIDPYSYRSSSNHMQPHLLN